jgi:hypothetical protein
VLSAEARVTLIDGYLAAAILVGLVLNALFAWWWAGSYGEPHPRLLWHQGRYRGATPRDRILIGKSSSSDSSHWTGLLCIENVRQRKVNQPLE